MKTLMALIVMVLCVMAVRADVAMDEMTSANELFKKGKVDKAIEIAVKVLADDKASDNARGLALARKVQWGGNITPAVIEAALKDGEALGITAKRLVVTKVQLYYFAHDIARTEQAAIECLPFDVHTACIHLILIAELRGDEAALLKYAEKGILARPKTSLKNVMDFYWPSLNRGRSLLDAQDQFQLLRKVAYAYPASPGWEDFSFMVANEAKKAKDLL